MEQNIEMVKKFVVEECIDDEGLRDEIDYDVNLIDSRIIDSLSILKIIEFVESNANTQVDIAEVEFDNFSSIRKIDTFIHSRSN